MDAYDARYDNDVFISYSQHQRRAAELVRDVLRENLLSCWIAPECIPAGSDYTAEIPRAIHGCKVLVLILSSDAQRSRWVQSEINNAIRENKVIIPFAIRNCKIESQFDFAISKSQRIVAYKNLSAALEQLVEAVYAQVQKQLVPVQKEYLKRRIRLYRRRRIILTLAAILLSAAVFAASAFVFGHVLDTDHTPERFLSGTIGSCEWQYDEQNAALTIYGAGSTYVKGTSSPWASYASEIKTLTVEEGVSALGYELMADCTSLTQVSLPQSLTELNSGVFMNCTSLEEITLPDQLVSVGIYAFNNCTSLRSISIPASLTKLDTSAFIGAGLHEFIVAPENERYASVDGVLFDKKTTRLISFPCCYEQATYAIPEGVTEICDRAFMSATNLRTVEMPDSLTVIGANAFNGCNAMMRVTLPEHLTVIKDNAFAHCSYLEEITVPESVTEIGESAFSFCIKLQSVELRGSINSLNDKTFVSCSRLTQITLPDGLSRICSDAFKNCAELRRIVIPSSVTLIEIDAFAGCRNLTLIGDSGSAAERFAADNGFAFEQQ